MKVKNRTFVISGGASGLGQACAEAIYAKGGYVAILDLNEELGEQISRARANGQARFFLVDVSQSESISAAVKGIRLWVQETGQTIGGVIAAAGIASAAKIIDRELNPFSLADFDSVMNINVRGTIDLIRQVLPEILKTTPAHKDDERAVIIMVASAAAFEGQAGQVSYAASKGAIASVTLPLTRDLSRYGVRVITIAPGLFDTGMTAMMNDTLRTRMLKILEFPVRFGQAQEFAQLAIHGIENTMLNGVVLRLDGGIRLPSKI